MFPTLWQGAQGRVDPPGGARKTNISTPHPRATKVRAQARRQLKEVKVGCHVSFPNPTNPRPRSEIRRHHAHHGCVTLYVLSFNHAFVHGGYASSRRRRIASQMTTFFEFCHILSSFHGPSFHLPRAKPKKHEYESADREKQIISSSR